MERPRLFVLDSVMVDVMMKVAVLPERGSDSLASTYLVATGGGFNVLAAAARHHSAALYAGKLGTGPLADLARGSLRAEDVAHPLPADPDNDTGFCLVLVDAEGERTFVTATGAELHLTREDLDGLDVREADYVYCSGYNLVYEEIGDTVVGWLESLPPGTTVATDLGARFADIPLARLHRALRRSDWLFASAREALALSGETTLEATLYALLAMTGREGVVVHDGVKGCLLATRQQAAVRVAGFPVAVVDTNGAGDTHNGVFLAELAHGTEVVEAARRANAAAALAVSRLGPAASPSREETARWFAEFAATPGASWTDDEE